jgi:hypothetical protein
MGESYPSVLVSDAALSYSVAGLPVGTDTEDVLTDIETGVR